MPEGCKANGCDFQVPQLGIHVVHRPPVFLSVLHMQQAQASTCCLLIVSHEALDVDVDSKQHNRIRTILQPT